MSPPPENPYEEQTRQNTSTAWLDGHEPVDLDIDGLVAFGKNMVTIRDNLDGSTGYLELLGTLPTQAWEGGTLGEAQYIATKMGYHYTELQQYLMFLSQGLNNIGMAAQTVADAFQGTDGWSAATLDAVEFAFGDTRGGPPPGLPPGFPTKTWMQAYQENLAAGNGAASGQLDQWRQLNTVYAGNVQITTYVNQDGVKRTISTATTGSGSETTITTYDANGDVVYTTRQTTSTQTVGNTVVTTKTNYDADGDRTGSTEQRTTYGNGGVAAEEVVNRSADNTVTGSSRTETHADGTQTVTTTRGDEQRVVEIGADTEGENSGSIDSPAQDTMKDIEGHSYPTAPWVLGR